MQKKNIDTTLVFLVLGLVIFGLVMISSVSVYHSYKITSTLVNSGKLEEANNYYFLLRTFFYIPLGILLMVIFSKIPTSFIEKNARNIFVVVVILLVLVFFVGTRQNGSTAWINIPLISFQLQPAEFAKIGIIIMLAYFMKKRRSLLSDFQMGVIPYFFYAGLVFLPLMLQPDFGSILVLTPVVIAMYFVGGGNYRYIGTIIAICIIGAIGVYGIGKVINHSGVGYISARIDNFFRSSQEIVTNPSPDGKDYQMKQGLIALGSGGFFGLGFGKSIQKFGYLPEVEGDFIFSVIVEELGFLGACCLLFVYFAIAYRGFLIARSVKDLFARYFAFGITTLIIVQMFINIGVNLNIIPLTGKTLPFVSYGGSSFISLMIGVGILLSISRHMEYHPQNLSDVLKAKRRAVL